MSDQDIIARLKKHSLYVTRSRVAVLKVLCESRAGASLAYIKKASSLALSRTTVYRTLQYFLQKRLIRAIPNSKGNLRYILSDHFDMVSFEPNTIQTGCFICSRCSYTELMKQKVSFVLEEPTRHQVNNWYIILEGICAKCLSE